ncbi:MAG: hypothetical protein V3V82_00315, partial [Acidimicrobiia bacterium]
MAAVVALGVCSVLTPSSTLGQQNGGTAASKKETVVVTLGERYAAGSLHGIFFGKRYRDLWATPTEVEVLDLSTFAGGLTPARAGGAGQTKSLHLDGADGRRYVVRSVDKDLHVPEDFHDTFLEDVMQDMKIHAFHPAAAVVVAPLMEAAGVQHVEPRLVVVPDDPRLGEFREEYAGLIGFIEERPNEGPDDSPGFAGSSKIVATETLLERMRESPRHRTDARDFLKARLLDMWFGDRDRHVGQWRWASFVDGEELVWRPIPRDRDEAFVANDGVVWWVAQRYLPRFTSFHDQYPDIGGLTENGWDLDRILLGGLGKQVWDSVAVELQEVLTDSVISAAVRQMPIEMYRKNGAELEQALESRRDDLRGAADAYYTLITKEVDVYGTDQAEVALVEYGDDGWVEVQIRETVERSGAVGEAPYYRPLFDPEETHEIRLYLRGGSDTVLVSGEGKKEIVVRVIGGGGDDLLVDSTQTDGQATRFYDGWGDNRFVTGNGTKVDVSNYTRPRPSGVGPHEFILDWGRAQSPVVVLRANSENGLILGGGILRYNYGFRKAPYRHRLFLSAALSTSGRVLFEYESRFAQVAPRLALSLHTWVSGVEPVNFYGFGNDTEERATTDFYKVDEYQVLVDPALIYAPSLRTQISFGPVFKYTDTRDVPGRLVQDSIYGAGGFGQLGAQLGLEWDARGQLVDLPRDFLRQKRWASGLNIKARVSLYPAILDVTDAFGEASAEVTPYVSLQVPTQ